MNKFLQTLKATYLQILEKAKKIKILQNARIGTKIMVGYYVVIGILVVMGGISTILSVNVSQTVSRVSGERAKEERLINEISTQIHLVNFYANQYANSHNDEDLELYDTQFADLENLLNEVDAAVTDKNRAGLLDTIQENVEVYKSSFDEMKSIIQTRVELYDDELSADKNMVDTAISNILTDALLMSNTSYLIGQAALANQYFATTHMNVISFVNSLVETDGLSAELNYYQAQTAIQTLREKTDNTDFLTNIQTAEDASTRYFEAFQVIQTGIKRQNVIVNEVLNPTEETIRNTTAEIASQVNADFDADLQKTKSLATNATVILLISVIVIIGFSLTAGFILSRSISQPLNVITKAATAIAEGDIQQEIKHYGKDEAGIMAEAFRNMIVYIQEIGNIAQNLSVGDLTVQVSSRSEKDILGNAFVEMVENLREAIGQVADSANKLHNSSQNLTKAAKQTGHATTEIVDYIKQIYGGNGSISHDEASIQQLSQAIENVAQGAQDQAEAVTQASLMTSEINNIIQEVSENASEVTRNAMQATEAARLGAKRVEETIQGMETIREKVDRSAEKVKEMEQRSKQIGQIVTLIREVSDQTNLLALNAAIEAARAGEHGKGFAVVADEVRKLADRSNTSTKEISKLLKDIQRTVEQAIQSMEEGTEEVASGVKLSQQAGIALQDILSASESAQERAAKTVDATEKMRSSSNLLVDSMDSVSAVVEENTAATQEMATSSAKVTRTIENIANATSQINTQVEEVNEAAQNFAEMAALLGKTVEHFKLNSSDSLLDGKEEVIYENEEEIAETLEAV